MLFVVPPARGHLLPCIPIAHQLQSSGDDVVFLTSAIFSDVLSEHGLRFVSYTDNLPGNFLQRTRYLNGHEIWMFEWSRDVLQNGPIREIFVRRIRQVAKAESIDLIVLDYFFRTKPQGVASRIAKEHQVVFISTSLLYTKSEKFFPHPRIVICPEEFIIEPVREYFRDVSYVEPSVMKMKVEGDERQQKGKDLLVFASFGTQLNTPYELLRRIRILAAVAARMPSRKFVVAVGPYASIVAKEIGVSLDNMSIEEEVDQNAILRNSDVFITHCGLGSIKEAILAKVPMVCWPFSGDQYFNARCVEERGLGLTVRDEEDVENTMFSILAEAGRNPAIRQRCDEMSGIFHAYEKNPIASDLLRSLALKGSSSA